MSGKAPESLDPEHALIALVRGLEGTSCEA